MHSCAKPKQNLTKSLWVNHQKVSDVETQHYVNIQKETLNFSLTFFFEIGT